MKKIVTSLMLSLVFVSFTYAGEGYKIGDKATDFSLKNVDGEYVSMNDFPDARGFVVVFTCNECPYAKAYQDRLIEIDKAYKKMGFPVIAVNPNDPEVSPSDSYEKMIIRAKEKSYSFPYLVDETQEVFRRFGATRTPHVFVLVKKDSELVVSYIGAIDNNYKDPGAVSEAYLTDALDALLSGENPETDYTKAVGCSIKFRK